MDSTPPAEAKELFGLSGLSAQPPERVPIRTRSTSVTQSGWRLEIRCDQGQGAILLVESGVESYRRGDGIFLGWTQEKLASLYDELLPKTSEQTHDSPQLG
jgi:hypothetical protein